MSITRAIRQGALAIDPGKRVARTVVGGIYVAVQLEGGAAGVAYRFPGGEGCRRGAATIPQPDALERPDAPVRPDLWAGRPARQLIPLLGGPDLVASALALATVNALCAARAASPGDVLDHLELRDGDRLCMVGCFLPVLERLKSRNIEVLAVDQQPKPGALPAEEIDVLLPSSQVALVTATALVNATLDRLLALAVSCRTVALLGPSTPMLPEAFSATPVRLLSGIRILDPDPLFAIVAAGGGFRDLRSHVLKVNLRI